MPSMGLIFKFTSDHSFVQIDERCSSETPLIRHLWDQGYSRNTKKADYNKIQIYSEITISELENDCIILKNKSILMIRTYVQVKKLL